MTSDPDPWTDVDAAEREYTKLQMAADAAKGRLFDACASAVQNGHSAEAAADRIKANKTEEERAAGGDRLNFTATYIRRQVRERGVAPLRSGPKKR